MHRLWRDQSLSCLRKVTLSRSRPPQACPMAHITKRSCAIEAGSVGIGRCGRRLWLVDGPVGSAFSHRAHWRRVKIDVMTGNHCRMPHGFPDQSVCLLPGHGRKRRIHGAVRDGRTDARQRNPGGTRINALWPRNHSDRHPTPPASAQELLAIGADGDAFCADLLGGQSRTNAGSGKRSGEVGGGGGRRGGASQAGSLGSVVRIPVTGPTEYTSAIATRAMACESTSGLAR